MELNWAGDPKGTAGLDPNRNVWLNFHGNPFLNDDPTWDTGFP